MRAIEVGYRVKNVQISQEHFGTDWWLRWVWHRLAEWGR